MMRPLIQHTGGRGRTGADQGTRATWFPRAQDRTSKFARVG